VQSNLVIVRERDGDTALRVFGVRFVRAVFRQHGHTRARVGESRIAARKPAMPLPMTM
jgi:hypothetical protein